MTLSAALTDRALAGSGAEAEVHASLEVLHELYNYNHWIFSKVRSHIHGSVCEVGCGTGNVTQFLLNQPRVVGIEPHEQSFRDVRRRFSDHLNVSFVPCRLQQCPNDDVAPTSFDTVICLNVLEHIEGDVDALLRMRRLCHPRGQVVILVPAHMSACGELDRSFGHYRRYNRRTLSRAFSRAGLKVTHSQYMNTLGYFGWLWEGRIMRRKHIRVSVARRFNRIVPFMDALERVIRPPFGQSLIMVGTPG